MCTHPRSHTSKYPDSSPMSGRKERIRRLSKSGTVLLREVTTRTAHATLTGRRRFYPFWMLEAQTPTHRTQGAEMWFHNGVGRMQREVISLI